MYSLLKVGTFGIQEFICDSYEDIEHLPKTKAGSTAFVIDENEGYILNNAKKWIKLF